jgi:hypothetical protein
MCIYMYIPFIRGDVTTATNKKEENDIIIKNIVCKNIDIYFIQTRGSKKRP